MLVVKFCEELLRSCGINNFVAVSDIPAFCLDNKLPTTSNIELVTVHLSPDQTVWVQGLYLEHDTVLSQCLCPPRHINGKFNAGGNPAMD